MRSGANKLKETLLRQARRPVFWIAFALYSGAAVVIGLMFASCAAGSIWLDEAISFGISEHSFYRAAAITAHDVHPPLYYFLLKAILWISSPFGADRIVVGKVVSVLPFVALFVYCLIFVRKDFGLLASGMFAFWIVSAPNLFAYASEVRMYSWSMAFVVAALIHLYEVMREPNRLFAWFALSFHTLCAAYTQYFALLAVFFLWLGLFVWMLVRARKVWLRFALFAGGTVLLYVPWMYILIRQFGAYSEHTSDSVNWDWLREFWAFTFDSGWMGILLTVGAAMILLLSFLRFGMADKNCFALIGVTSWLCTAWILTILPLATNHQIFSRYLFPALGCLWYPVCVLAAGLTEKPLPDRAARGAKRCLPAVGFALAAIFSLSAAGIGIFETKRADADARGEARDYRVYREAVLDQIAPGDAVIGQNTSFTVPVLRIMLPEADVYGWLVAPEAGWMIDHMWVLSDEEEILELARSRTVWYFSMTRAGTFASLEEACAAEGIPFSYIGYYPQVDTENCSLCYIARFGGAARQ